MPARPRNVRTWPPRLSASAATSLKMSLAAMPAALRPCASVAPTATAAAFFAHPASSTPDGVVGHLAHDAGALEQSAQRCASRSECEAHTSPAPLRGHLARVRGAADASDPVRPEHGLERERRRRRRPAARGPSRGRRSRRRRDALALELGERLARPFDGTARKTGRRDGTGPSRPPKRAHLELPRQGDARQIVLVLAALRQLLGLLGGPAQERRAHAGAHEEQRHGCAERPRSYHRCAHGGTVSV